ncbi:MAG TPA: TonB-dependent receptor, partial [Novosphingobium sp.]|nr:TonB-dependent receptor [Novosphingobium sp.]
MRVCTSLLAGVAFASLAWGGAAVAQDNAVNSAPLSSDDIIVTATKREQTLQDVPVAVTVTTGGTIEQAQIRDLKDLQSVVPSLRVNQLQSSA